MTVLAIETATAVCAVAVVADGKTRSEFELDAPRVHSEKLVALIDRALAAASVKSGAIDGIAVSIGPGSFTGLRIGLSVAKGLAYAWTKPLAAVPTLEALAWEAARSGVVHRQGLILPMIDARRDEVYVAGYRYDDGRLEENIAPQSMTMEELMPIIRDNEYIVMTGDGAGKLKEFAQGKYPEYASRISLPVGERFQCRASAVGLIGERQLLNGNATNLETLEPMYVKDFHTLLKTQHSTVQ
ncbi:MAG: tRNA (adenosine(37)-N6)-threonylcarbamoyltransferase complex dimerization subunit type 1 TsaB [Bacteroidota bacterium]|jgi:tRNA threonylcarbamoyladenosine biosynthesis protein TsaB